MIIGSLAFGAQTLREFALALFIGIALGTYSSIFVAAPLLAMWKEREEEWVRARKRVERRRLTGEKTEPAGVAAVAVAESSEIPEQPGAAEPPADSGPSGATPRPPKKRKKRR